MERDYLIHLGSGLLRRRQLVRPSSEPVWADLDAPCRRTSASDSASGSHANGDGIAVFLRSASQKRNLAGRSDDGREI